MSSSSHPPAVAAVPALPGGPGPVACVACLSEQPHAVIQAREMMFGFRDCFHYQECASCGHLQLLDVPDDLSRYYPADYYSLGARGVTPSSAANPLARGLSEVLLRLPPSVCDRLAAWRRIDPVYSALAGLGLSTRARIADVGCGDGELLVRLWQRGFRHLAGVDPHVERDIEVAPSVWVRKLAAEQLVGEFDAILLNHSLEHMNAPREVLSGLRELLAPEGAIVVRVPIAGVVPGAGTASTGWASTRRGISSSPPSGPCDGWPSAQNCASSGSSTTLTRCSSGAASNTGATSRCTTSARGLIRQPALPSPTRTWPGGTWSRNG